MTRAFTKVRIAPPGAIIARSSLILRTILSALAIFALSPAFSQGQPVLTVYVYDSFVNEYGPGKAIAEAFEANCACKINYVAAEDGAALLSRLKLEGAATKADVVLGLDTNLMGEAVKSGLFVPHGLQATSFSLPVAWKDETFLPFDWSYFAFVYDATKLKSPPASLKQLVEDKNGPRIIIQDPRTSTPGLGLLVWVKSVYAEKALDAWAQLKPRIVTVTKGWSEAYGLFLKGEADMVLSYSTSPAYHIEVEKKTNYRAAMFSEGHIMQIEVAALIASSREHDLGRTFLAFLLTDQAQALLPQTNWMYPVKTPKAGLPDAFKSLQMPDKTLSADPAQVAASRRAWIEEWLAAMAK